jgi:hypothetical protein
VAELADGTSFVDQGVSPGTTNYYRVRARTIAGVSAYSAEASAVTPGAGTDLPMNELLWWLKADTGAVRLGTNGNVRQWLDVSGNQYDANQASSANQPRWIDTAINGRPAVRFDGTNDYFTLPEFLAGALQAEVFVVLKAAEDVPTGWRILWKLGGDNYAPFYPYTDGTIREDFGSKTVRIIPNPQQALDAFHMFNVSASMSGWEARVNGVFLLGMTNYFHHWPTPTLGSSSSSYFAGDVAEIMLFTRTLTALERDAVGEYLDAKYSLESTATDASGPSTPTNLLATAHAPGQILLSWTRPTTNESSFQIERKLGTNGNYEVLDVIASGSTNYLDEAVDPQSAYFYRIKAHNYFGDSGYSDQVSPPLVTITFPLHPATSTPGATNSVSAQATDTDGSVVEVEFYVQGTLVGTATNAPYSASWIASEIGVAVLTAKAIDDQGNSQFSEEVLVRVYPDTDEDGLADDIEAILGTDPSDADTDGDSVPDAEDAFPLDPTRSTLPSSDPEDDTGPAITLDEPLNATLLP